MNKCTECNKSKMELPPRVIEIANEVAPALFFRKNIPASVGDDITNPPDSYDLRNVLLYYEANRHAYLFDSAGIATRIVVDVYDIDAIIEDLDNLGIEVKEIDSRLEALNDYAVEEVKNLRDNDANLQKEIEEEVENRKQAISDLQIDLDEEATKRQEAIDALETKVTGEIGNDIAELQSDLANETTARENSDNDLQEQIDAIESKSDVVDVVDTYAQLESYSTASLGDNDVVKVLQDETHDGAISYYRWNKTVGTWGYVGSVGPYYTKAEVDEKIQESAGEGVPERAKRLPWQVIGQESLIPDDMIQIRGEGDDWYISVRAKDLQIGSMTSSSKQTNANFPLASSATAGFMSIADKAKLDSIPESGGGGSDVKLYSAYGSNEDGALTQKFVSDKLNDLVVAIGSSASGSSQGDVALGASAQARYGSVAIGQSAKANPTGSTSSVSIGASAGVNQEYGAISIGYNAKGRTQGIAIGVGSSTSSGDYAVALGWGSSATGVNTVALGRETKATKSASVALGKDAATSREGEVSIGSGSLESSENYRHRFLANVRAGVLDEDAVNVGQLNAALGDIQSILESINGA